MNIHNNLIYAFNGNNIRIASPEEVPFLRPEYSRDIQNEIIEMPSGVDYGWSPLIALTYDSEIVGYIHFDMTLPYVESESDYLEDYQCSISFYLKYLYIKEDFRGEGLYSQFINDFLEQLLEQLSYNLEQTNYDTGYFNYSAEYVSDAGKYLGSKISEEFEEFASKHYLNYEESIN